MLDIKVRLGRTTFLVLMKVLYLDHEAVRFFSNCANGVQLQCARSDTHIQNCTVKTVRASSQAGVICGELGI